jgi:peptide deformylase
MFATMYVAEGVGLAANQVDVDLRVFVYDCPDGDGHPARRAHLQPRHRRAARRRPRPGRGRRGLPVRAGAVQAGRPPRPRRRARHRLGGQRARPGAATGFFARCLQHETDHLNGYLYIDRLPARARKDVLKQMQKMRDEVMAKRAANASERY